VSGSSPAVGEKEEEASGGPTMGEGGRCGAEGGRRRGCDGGGDMLSTTRGSGRGETRVGAALDAMDSGRGVGAFYRAGEEGRQPVGGARRWPGSAL
jgi:hypothetical protein